MLKKYFHSSCVLTRLDKWEKGYPQFLNPEGLPLLWVLWCTVGAKFSHTNCIHTYTVCLLCKSPGGSWDQYYMNRIFFTVGTYKRSLSCMKSLMLYKAYFLPEGVTIFILLLGFVPTMSFLMYKEISLWGEAFPTFTTYKRFLSCMGSLMDN